MEQEQHSHAEELCLQLAQAEQQGRSPVAVWFVMKPSHILTQTFSQGLKVSCFVNDVSRASCL